MGEPTEPIPSWAACASASTTITTIASIATIAFPQWEVRVTTQTVHSGGHGLHKQRGAGLVPCLFGDIDKISLHQLLAWEYRWRCQACWRVRCSPLGHGVLWVYHCCARVMQYWLSVRSFLG